MRGKPGRDLGRNHERKGEVTKKQRERRSCLSQQWAWQKEPHKAYDSGAINTLQEESLEDHNQCMGRGETWRWEGPLSPKGGEPKTITLIYGIQQWKKVVVFAEYIFQFSISFMSICCFGFFFLICGLLVVFIWCKCLMQLKWIICFALTTGLSSLLSSQCCYNLQWIKYLTYL